MNIISYSHLHKERNFTYRFCDIKNYNTGAHTHAFYEYFFVMSGTALHVYNGEEIVLEKGALFFIQPEDEHDFLPIDDQDCEWVNVAFSSRHVDNAFAYLELSKDEFLNADKTPFYVKLSDFNRREFVSEHEYLNVLFKDDLEINVYFKKLLLKVIGLLVTQYEKNAKQDNYAQLFDLLGTIDSLQVLQEGVPALVRLSGLSHGHLCRLMKERLNTTPSRHITDLRLACAANLLLHSDLSVLDIAGRVGYFSFSHFMRLFKAKYGCTPLLFRKKNVKK